MGDNDLPQPNIEYMELKKDKKYINNLNQIIKMKNKSTIKVLIVVTFRERDCVQHICEIYK